MKIKIENEDKNCEIKEIYGLSLRERKQKVIDELKKENLILNDLEYLLPYDNTNEELLCRYIISLNKVISSQKKEENQLKKLIPVEEAIVKYSNYISITKLNELTQKIFPNSYKEYRNISYKEIFFNFLIAIKNDDIKNLETEISKLNRAVQSKELNNQPYDTNNFEPLYFYICSLLSFQIEKNKNELEKYFKNIKSFLSKIEEIDKYKNCKDNEQEKKDINKFLIIVFAIVNLDNNNYNDILQVARILNAPKKNLEEMISFCVEDIKYLFDNEKAEEFKKKLEDNKNFYTINYKLVEDKIELSEYCYLYDYIIQNNVFKKYQKEIISLLDIIYKSDLVQELLKTVYGEDYERLAPIFQREYSTEDFWNNVILFIPFKMERISRFSYKKIFKIFISIYKNTHFKTNLENELFTLGAFIRTLIHESLGHFIISYIFFMFYVNTKDQIKYINSQRIEEKIQNLNKKNNYIQLLGNNLAKIEFEINNEIKDKENKTELELNFYEILEKELFKKYKAIIGNEYAKILSKKLIENRKESKISDNLKEEDLLIQSEKIINILFKCILDDFDEIIKKMNLRQEAYKSAESGNLIEILLFNDFSQDMTIKECLFLLNEDNYKNTNIFKFRSEFKSILEKNNNNFLTDLKNGNKIFSNLFSQYFSIYEKNKFTQQDFISSKTFRENSSNNTLIKKYGSFQCFNIKIDYSLLPTDPKYS